MIIQKWWLPAAFALSLVGCGGGGGGGGGHMNLDPPSPPTEIDITGRAKFSNEYSLDGAQFTIDEINVSQTVVVSGTKVQGKLIEKTTVAFTVTPTVQSNGNIALKLKPGQIEDAKLYRIGVRCPTPTTDACPLTKPLSAAISGERLKQGNWSVSVLTEIAYQRLAYYIKAGYSVIQLQSDLQAAAETLLIGDINGDTKLDYEDILQWDDAKSDAVRRPLGMDAVKKLIVNNSDDNELLLAVQALAGSIAGNVKSPGIANGVVLSGDFAYVAAGNSGLQIIDISDINSLSSFREVDIPGGQALQVAVVGDYAYVAAGTAGLKIINISSPDTPVIENTVDTFGSARDIVISDNYAYVVDTQLGLRIIDISTPAVPKVVKDVLISGELFRVAVAGDYAYVAAGISGLRVIDIHSPAEAAEIGSGASTVNKANDVAVAGNYAYVTEDHSDLPNYDATKNMEIFDISTPSTPKFATSLDTPHIAKSVTVIGEYAYVADTDSGLQIVDIRTPLKPFITNSVDFPGKANQVAVAGDYAYVAAGSFGLQVIDIRSRPGPVFIGSRSTESHARSIAVVGQYAYVPVYDVGLEIIDIKQPWAPVLASSVKTPGHAEQVTVMGDYAYMAAGEAGLQIISISSPLAPQIVPSTPPTPRGYAGHVYVEGDYAYVAYSRFKNFTEGQSGLQILNIHTPEAPVEVGWIGWDSGITDGVARVTVRDNYAYVLVGADKLNTERKAGLKIIDLHTLETPTVLKDIHTPGDAKSVSLSGNYAYVADYGAGLQVIDLTTSEIVHNIKTGYAIGIAIAGDYAYMGDGQSGMQVFDIKNPRSTKILGAARTEGSIPWAVSVAGEYVFLATVKGIEIHLAVPPG